MRKTKIFLKATTFLVAMPMALLASGNTLAQTQNEYTNQPNHEQIGLRSSIHEQVTSAGNTLTGEGVGIAILDGLVDANHSDLAGRVVIPDPLPYSGSYNYANSHGTHVAGIIGASLNGSGVVGIAPGATLYSFPVFTDGGSWSAYDQGATVLRNIRTLNGSGANIRAVNMSYGPKTAGDVFLSGELNLFSQYKDDFVMVRAAGNSGANAKYEYYNGVASTDLSHLLVVGSVNGSNSISSFSNKPGEACIGSSSTCSDSEKIKEFWIVAPGQRILSTVPGGLGYKSGTSMAAPHVTGAVAVVWQNGWENNVALTPTDVASILKLSATDLGATGVDNVYGWGLLNIEAALQPIGGIGVPIGDTVDDTVLIEPPPAAEEPPPPSDETTKPKRERKTRTKRDRKTRSTSLLSGMIVLDGFNRPFEVTDLGAEPEFPTPSGDHLAKLSSVVFSQKVVEIDTDKFSIAAWSSMNSAQQPAASFHYVSDSLELNVGTGSPSVFFSAAQNTLSEDVKPERLDGAMFAALGDVGRVFDEAMSVQAVTPLSESWELSSFALQSISRKAFLPGISTPVPYYEGQESASFLGVGADRRFGEYSTVGLTYAALHEKGTLLGENHEGIFGFGKNALTQTMGLRFSTQLADNFSLNGFYSHALVNGLGSRASVFENANWQGNQFGLSLAAKDAAIEDDQLRLSVIKPLEFTSGTISARVPVGREFDGTIVYDYRSTEVERGYFPISFQFDYLAPLGPFKTMLSMDATNAGLETNGIFRFGIMGGLNYAF